MTPSTQARVEFRFGTELEVVIGSKTRKPEEWDDIAKELREELEKAAISNHINFYELKNAVNYREWSIVKESSIKNEKNKNEWGMELVSPILDFKERTDWHGQMEKVWSVLSTKFVTKSTSQCSTHVHISPIEGKWTLDQVKAIAKAVLYYERSVDSVMPVERRKNPWAQTNRNNILLRNKTMEASFEMIDKAENFASVASVMCAHPVDPPHGQHEGSTAHFTHNIFRWNFLPIKEGPERTIEFRQPPGSSSKSDTKLWVSFTASFIQAAILNGDDLDCAEEPTLERFKAFLIDGAIRSGVDETDVLDKLFDNKTQLPLGTHNLQDISDEDLAIMRTKAKELNITVEKFKSFFGYK